MIAGTRGFLALPADPNRLFAARLREFLGATSDADFPAPTIALTGGPDGIEFVDPTDRSRQWLWRCVVSVGKEAAAAARSAAQAWLGEIDP